MIQSVIIILALALMFMTVYALGCRADAQHYAQECENLQQDCAYLSQELQMRDERVADLENSVEWWSRYNRPRQVM